MRPGNPCPNVPGIGDTVMCGRAGGPNFDTMNSTEDATSVATRCNSATGLGAMDACAGPTTIEPWLCRAAAVAGRLIVCRILGCSAVSNARLAHTSTTYPERSTC